MGRLRNKGQDLKKKKKQLHYNEKGNNYIKKHPEIEEKRKRQKVSAILHEIKNFINYKIN